jgi:hypothetical protein
MAVILAQQNSREALSSDELAHSKTINTHDQSSLDSLISRIQLHLKGR